MMPTTINPIKKKIVKRELLKSKSARAALKAADYGKGSIRRSTAMPVVKECVREITAAMPSDNEIIADFIYGKLLALKNNDLPEFRLNNEDIAKIKGMFKDVNVHIHASILADIDLNQAPEAVRDKVLSCLRQDV